MTGPIHLRWKLAAPWFALSTSIWILGATAGLATADVVVVHDRGKKIRPEASDSAELIRISRDLLRRSQWRTGLVSTDEIRVLRANEVVVEVHFDEPQELELSWTDDRARPQHLLIPLTGEQTGVDGNTALVFSGRNAEPNEARYLGLEYVNAPDEYRVQYTTSYSTPGGLQQLRQAVVRLGVDAPQSTPRPTPEVEMPPP